MRTSGGNASYWKSFSSTVLTLCVTLLAACTGGSLTGSPAQTPVLNSVEVPTATPGQWQTVSFTTSTFAVLPVKGRGVRLDFNAPKDSVFNVTIAEPDGTMIALSQHDNTPVPPDDGYFSIIDVNTNSTPALYRMYVRTPAVMSSPEMYQIQVVNLGTPNSSPMTVNFGAAPRFTVKVQVTGDGHVTSNPGGITCGSSSQGPLSPCSFDFGQSVTLSLNPNSNQGSKFIGWTGNCIGKAVCTLTLDGAPVAATAVFAPDSSSMTVMSCPVAQRIPGLRWIDMPACATGHIDEHPGITLQCDAAGFFCCEPQTNASSTRCGADHLESVPDCRADGIHALLRQPGGCYESDEFP